MQVVQDAPLESLPETAFLAAARNQRQDLLLIVEHHDGIDARGEPNDLVPAIGEALQVREVDQIEERVIRCNDFLFDYRNDLLGDGLSGLPDGLVRLLARGG